MSSDRKPTNSRPKHETWRGPRVDPTIEPLPRREIRSRPGRASNTAELVDAFGVDTICDLLCDGHLMAEIAAHIGVSPWAMRTYLENRPEAKAQVRAARVIGAESYVRKAEQVLEDSRNGLEIHRARELASHYRWMAKAMDRSGYGDHIEVTQTDDPAKLKDDELDRRIARLLAKANDPDATEGDDAGPEQAVGDGEG